MFGSILKDAQYYIRNGNMITRIILINCVVFIGVVLLKVFTGGWMLESGGSMYNFIVIENMAIPSQLSDLLWHPWTVITHMFLHEGIWHLGWNMLLLYWFGQIAGDLLGDHRMMPIYFMGGLVGAAVYLLGANFIPSIGMGYALGASACVMSIVMATGLTAPEYNMRLILLGNVPLKYIVLGILVLDLVGMASSNAGGSIAHLGGALFGGLYVYSLRKGVNIGAPMDWLIGLFNRSDYPVVKSPMHVAHRSKLISKVQKIKDESPKTSDHQEMLDDILDKIKKKGFDNLSEDEKDFLYQASKK